QFETATLTAMRTGYSTDLVIQAFAHTARTANISAELVSPFFASMRTDLLEAPGRPGSDADRVPAAGGDTCFAGADTAAAGGGDPATAGVRTYDGAAHAQYVYGSAEVVGLMCLRIFLRGQAVDAKDRSQMETGARQLGAALQNINFLRDFSEDTARLGRHYLGTVSELTPDIKARWVAVAQEQLDDAQAALPLLPSDARRAVCGVHGLFSELLARIAAAECEELHRRRIRVPDSRKARILGQALLSDRDRKRAK
ncbi:MAG TPA: squalene/phytoene synthase family protein, partial [Actinomycetales bacterium]|nr:squalene/phytoene synthase family protein [Actinomycetales bacterium]